VYNVTLESVRATITAVEKAVSITYSECVFVVIRHAMRVRHIAICGLSGSIVFFDIINGTIFGGKKAVEHKILCFDFLYNFCMKHLSF
jgi:hypothetical protein